MSIENIRTPSFWDYLGQGIQQFHESGVNSAERRRQQELQDREEAYKKFQTMMTLASQGQVDTGALQTASKGFLPEGVSISGETPLQSRARILKMPEKTSLVPKLAPVPAYGEQRQPTPRLGETTEVKGRDQVPDEELQLAGLMTSSQKRSQRLEDFKTDTQLAALGGQLPTSETVARLTNTMTPGMEQFERLKQYQPVLDSAAARFVAGAIGRSGGRIKANAADMQKISQSAYDEFVKASNIAIPPELESVSRSYFDKALRDEYVQQLELDNQRLMYSMRYANNQDDMFRALDGSVRTQADILKTMMAGTSGLILQQFMNMPSDQIPANYRQQVQLARQRITQLNAQMEARNQLGARYGMSPVTREELLNADSPVGTMVPQGGKGVDLETLRAQAKDALGAARTEGQRRAIKEEFKKITGQDLK